MNQMACISNWLLRCKRPGIRIISKLNRVCDIVLYKSFYQSDMQIILLSTNMFFLCKLCLEMGLLYIIWLFTASKLYLMYSISQDIYIYIGRFFNTDTAFYQFWYSYRPTYKLPSWWSNICKQSWPDVMYMPHISKGFPEQLLPHAINSS